MTISKLEGVPAEGTISKKARSTLPSFAAKTAKRASFPLAKRKLSWSLLPGQKREISTVQILGSVVDRHGVSGPPKISDVIGRTTILPSEGLSIVVSRVRFQTFQGLKSRLPIANRQHILRRGDADHNPPTESWRVQASRIIQAIAMPVSLDQIVSATRKNVAEAKRVADLRELERRAEQHIPRGFRRALQEAGARGGAVWR